MSFTAVIRISEFDESPTRALDSILENKSKFAKVLIITTNKTTVNKKYTPLDIEQKPSLKVVDVPTGCVFEVPPGSKFTPSTIEKTEAKIETSSFEKTVFHIPTTTTVKPTPIYWSVYGFILVSHVLQWVRQWWDKGMYERDDIVARLVITKGTKRVISTPNAYNVDTYIDDDSATIVAKDGLFRHIKTHRNYGLGWWVLWTLWLSTCVFFTFVVIASGTIHPRVLAIAIRLIVVCYSCILQLLSYKYIHIPGKVVFMACFPVYLMMFPFVVFYYRLKIKQRE